jgi:deazaflavin-dependent oxidoreductase (nitroreductase family)
MPNDFNASVIAEFRSNRGRVGGDLADTPIILVHHIGAKTRTEHVTPLAYSSWPDGHLVIAASNGGSAAHPAWYHNLKAHPTIDVELGTERFTVHAEEVEGAERAALWAKLAAASPSLAEFQAKTARRVPLFTLTRCASLVARSSGRHRAGLDKRHLCRDSQG